MTRAEGRQPWLPRWLDLPIGAAFAALVGALDFVTGRELGFSIFYLLPVAWVTWRAAAARGSIIALFGAVVWYLVETLEGQSYSHPAVALWNAAMRLGFFLVAAYAVDRARRALERERSLSQTDSLTGLPNARAFQAAALAELERARRSRSPLSIGYIDLDNFKKVNDTLGHVRGDEVLRAVGAALRASVRVVDVPARLGGDEFVVLLPDTAADGSRSASDRIQQALLQATARAGHGVTFSIGVVTFYDPPSSTTELIQRADRLMYAVKGAGKNAVRHETVGRPGERPRRAA